MCGNCNCDRGSVFCLDERMIFILLLIFLFVNCGGSSLFGGLLGGSAVSYHASYSSSGMSFDFNYTKSVPKDLKLTKNPLFSSANWRGSELTLKFKETNGMVGYRAYFDGSNLILRFNNVPTSLANAPAG